MGEGARMALGKPGREGERRQHREFGGSHVEEQAVTFAGHPVPAEPVARPAGAEEAAQCVVAGMLAGTALTRLPALVDIWGMWNTLVSPAVSPVALSTARAHSRVGVPPLEGESWCRHVGEG